MSVSRPLELPACVVPDLTQEKVVDAAIAGGFDACGFFVDPISWTAGTTKLVKGRVQDTGIRVIDVEVAMFRPGAFNEDDLRYVDIGLELGAESLIVMSWDPELSSNGEKLNRLCRHAAGKLTVALEFFPATQVKNMERALEIIKRADHPSAKIMIDAVHLDRSGGKPSDVRRIDPKLMDYIQISDVGPQTYARDDYDSNRREARDLRVLCGEGILPLKELISLVPDSMPVSIELRSVAAVRAIPDAMERADHVAKSTRAFLARIKG